jgi:hypothetical protein
VVQLGQHGCFHWPVAPLPLRCERSAEPSPRPRGRRAAGPCVPSKGQPPAGPSLDSTKWMKQRETLSNSGVDELESAVA